MKNYLAEVFLISLPQNFAIVLGLYAFNKQKINAKRFWICMAISLGAIFCIRILPISFVMHTLLGMAVLVFLGVYYLQFPIHKAIRSVLFTTLINLSVEIINVLVFTMVLGKDRFNTIMDNPFYKAVIGFPASLTLLVIIYIIYILLVNHKKRGSTNGETGSSNS